MQVYLPIAEMSVNALVIVGMGWVAGVLSGLFGVGGGFLLTPLLIFIGVPPAVAVGTQANQLIAASVSGVLGHWRRGAVDVKMALVMQLGSAFGIAFGIVLFGILQRLGQIDLVISLLYVGLLGFVGLSMLAESVLALIRGHPAQLTRRSARGWLQRLPFQMRFPRSKLYVSALLPLAIGMAGGVMVAVMGIGGGFLMVPAMLYILRMPVALVAGTSLFQIIASTAIVTLLQASLNHTVDVMLALLLLAGGVVGAQAGTRLGTRLRGETARALLALLVVLVALGLAWQLIQVPVEPYSLVTEVAR